MRRLYWKLLLVVIPCLGIMNCATLEHRPAGARLLGQSREAIIACAGNPVDERQEHDLLLLFYYKEATILEEDFPQAKSSLPKTRHGCRVRLGFKDDHVVGVEYDPVPASYLDYDHCEEIFTNCSLQKAVPGPS